MWNLKNKTNKQTKNKNRLIDTESKWVVSREEEDRGWSEIGEGD